MNKFFLTSITIIFLVSCEAKKAPLYYWSSYSKDSYNHLKNSDDKSKEVLLATYEKMIEKHSSSKRVLRNEVPPGIYADYGFLLIQLNRTEEGKKMLLSEIALYPESKIFIDRILKMIEE